MARDSYSYLHFVMVAGIVMVALGLKKTLGDVDEPLKTVPAFALMGGVAFYLLGHVAFRYRHIHTINRQRLGLAVVLLVAFPLATETPAIATAAVVAAALWLMIAYETRTYGDRRRELRAQVARGEI
jgi:low temperature requirement protein LtrA